MHRFSLAVWMAFAAAASPTLGSANECPAASGSVRVMVHATNLITGRLKLAVKAGRSPDRQASALRKLFEAAGCPQISELGKGRKRDVMCTVPGSSDRIIVVGVNHRYDSAASAALLPSLAEALAAAPRRHTYRWVGHSPANSAIDPLAGKTLVCVQYGCVSSPLLVSQPFRTYWLFGYVDCL